MLDISSTMATMIAAGAFVVGVMLLLWGRKTGGFFLMLVGAGAGLAISDIMIRLTGQNPIVVRLASAVILTFAAYLTSRALWAELAADVVGAAGYAVVIFQCRLALPDFPGQLQWVNNGWRINAWHMGELAVNALLGLWKTNGGELMAVGGATGIAFILALVLGRTTKILMTSLLGAGGIVGGTVLLCLTLRPGLGPLLRDHWYIPAGLAAGFFLAGAAFQWQQSAAAAKAALAAKAEKEGRDVPDKKHHTGHGRASDE